MTTIVDDVKSYLLASASQSSKYQRIHLVGHSRGAAVNALGDGKGRFAQGNVFSDPVEFGPGLQSLQIHIGAKAQRVRRPSGTDFAYPPISIIIRLVIMPQ